MRRVENVEKPLHPVLARLSVVRAEKRHGKQSEKLSHITGRQILIDRQRENPDDNQSFAQSDFLRQIRENRQEHPDKAVIDGHNGGKSPHGEDGGKKGMFFLNG